MAGLVRWFLGVVYHFIAFLSAYFFKTPEEIVWEEEDWPVNEGDERLAQEERERTEKIYLWELYTYGLEFFNESRRNMLIDIELLYGRTVRDSVEELLIQALDGRREKYLGLLLQIWSDESETWNGYLDILTFCGIDLQQLLSLRGIETNNLFREWDDDMEREWNLDMLGQHLTHL